MSVPDKVPEEEEVLIVSKNGDFEVPAQEKHGLKNRGKKQKYTAILFPNC